MAVRLILEVLQATSWEVGDSWHKVFDVAGGRIGRGLDCDWVLSNPYMSRHHATVSCVEDVFHIESVGENGVALNDPGEWLSKPGRHALKDGDRLFLDEYEISVAIVDVAEPGTHPELLAELDTTAFFNGAGLDPRSVPAEMSTTLGQILRAVVQGIIELLHARSQFRDQLHISLPREQMLESNPLEVVSNAEEALAAVLRSRSPSDLPPLKAFEDALEELRFHQLAMLAGIRAEFANPTYRWDPQKALDATFRLQGDAFSDAYARQLADLQRQRATAST